MTPQKKEKSSISNDIDVISRNSDTSRKKRLKRKLREMFKYSEDQQTSLFATQEKVRILQDESEKYNVKMIVKD